MIFQIISLLILLALTYYPTFIWMEQRWTAADSYYSHGFLIPFVVAYLIFHRRNEFKSIALTSQPSGIGLLIIGILIHLISRWLQVGFISGFSLLLAILGISLYLWGKGLTRLLLFPIAFTFFMIPLPLVVISNLSLKLKIFAAEVSVGLVKKLGFMAVTRGSTIVLAHSTLTVGDPCSGLRSLISLLALGAIFAYFIKTTRRRKIIIFLCSIPIALLANIFRISSMCLVAEIYGEEIALGVYHNISGILLFILAFILLFLVGRLLGGSKE